MAMSRWKILTRVLVFIFLVQLSLTFTFWTALCKDGPFTMRSVAEYILGNYSSYNYDKTGFQKVRFNFSTVNVSQPVCNISSNISDSLQNRSLTEDEVCIKHFVKRYGDYCKKSLRPSQANLRDYAEMLETETLPCLCPCFKPNQHVLINLTYDVLRTNELEAKYNTTAVKPGGRWFPTWCTPRHRVAIIIPFADRHDHLNIFLDNMVPFLQNQLVDYTIFVIEQVTPELFNRASLMNAGFVEVSSRGGFDCFIFQDVDQLPIDNINYYVCSDMPRHMCAFREKLNYKIAYPSHFGGVVAFSAKYFQIINGFSNRFYGWGLEDDDLRNRVDVKMVPLSERWPVCVAKYRMIPHERDKRNPIGLLKAFPEKFYRPADMDFDGLNSLNYTLLNVTQHQLYTRISINLPPPPSYPVRIL